MLPATGSRRISGGLTFWTTWPVGLMIASLTSWTVIFGKLFGLRKIKAANDEFEREFWAGRNLNDLYADATKQGGDADKPHAEAHDAP